MVPEGFFLNNYWALLLIILRWSKSNWPLVFEEHGAILNVEVRDDEDRAIADSTTRARWLGFVAVDTTLVVIFCLFCFTAKAPDFLFEVLVFIIFFTIKPCCFYSPLLDEICDERYSPNYLLSFLSWGEESRASLFDGSVCYRSHDWLVFE